MKAVVYEGPRNLKLWNMPRPSPNRGEVLIETKAVGICGSDLGIYKGEFSKIIPPLIIGHEGGGIVREIGTGIMDVKVGDYVAVSPILYCGKCEYCRQGKYSLCNSLRTIGMINAHGEYAEYFVAPEQNCHILPESIPWPAVGLIDTLAGPVLAMQRLKLPLGATVAVFGPGPAGLFFTKLAKLSGATEVYLMGTRDERLALGAEYGADLTVNVLHEDTKSMILKRTKGRGVDVVIEAAGSSQALNEAIAILRKGGSLLLYGVYSDEPIAVPMLKFVLNEFNCFGIADNTNGYPLAIKLLEKGTINVNPLITHTFTIDELPDAFTSGLIEKRLDGYMKGVVIFE